MNILENEEFKSAYNEINKKFNGLSKRTINALNAVIKSSAVTVEFILSKQHDKEMEEFEIWKMEKRISMVRNEGRIECFFPEKSGGLKCDYGYLLDLFRKENP